MTYTACFLANYDSSVLQRTILFRNNWRVLYKLGVYSHSFTVCDHVAVLQDFNAISDDIRDDEETRAEMHERVDDLRERLWTICDERKEQAEKERVTVMNEGWLEDRLGILSNDYITVLQCELDRFQDTLRLLKDYYRSV